MYHRRRHKNVRKRTILSFVCVQRAHMQNVMLRIFHLANCIHNGNNHRKKAMN